MFKDLSYKQMEAIMYEMVEKDIELYDLYKALSEEQLRRLMRVARIGIALREKSQKVK